MDNQITNLEHNWGINLKVGIITHYYKSDNYGGNLQAYALCEYINRYLGCEAEQISYDKKSEKKFKLFAWKIYNSVRNYKNFLIYSKLKKRRKALLHFNQDTIKHSIPYSNQTINNANNEYDVFITGSDQVWHPSAVCPAYLLNFVQKGKTKLSYAASLAIDELPDCNKDYYRKSLNDYTAISVRESNAVDILGEIIDKKIEVVLDPTLLLSKEDWDNICDECNVPDKYLFCFFLGNDVNHRKLANDYAKRKELKIVTLPNLLGSFRNCDSGFGDYCLYDVSPTQFISLVKNSEMVFTDSFHASVFSIIYKKDFFVFERNSKKSMGSRIYTLMEMFDLKERFCDTKEKMTIEYMEKFPTVDYNKKFEKYEVMKEKSELFLRENLKKNES